MEVNEKLIFGKLRIALRQAIGYIKVQHTTLSCISALRMGFFQPTISTPISPTGELEQVLAAAESIKLFPDNATDRSEVCFGVPVSQLNQVYVALLDAADRLPNGREQLKVCLDYLKPFCRPGDETCH